MFSIRITSDTNGFHFYKTFSIDFIGKNGWQKNLSFLVLVLFIVLIIDIISMSIFIITTNNQRKWTTTTPILLKFVLFINHCSLRKLSFYSLEIARRGISSHRTHLNPRSNPLKCPMKKVKEFNSNQINDKYSSDQSHRRNQFYPSSQQRQSNKNNSTLITTTTTTTIDLLPPIISGKRLHLPTGHHRYL